MCLIKMKIAIIILASVLGLASAGTPWVPEPVNETGWYQYHERFVENTIHNSSSIKVLFYGDSITHWWSSMGLKIFREYYEPLGAANYGISGDRTEQLIWRMQNGELTNLNPKVCVLKIGTNNIGPNDDMSVATGVAFTVNELRERLPNTKVLLVGILPRENEEQTRRVIAINNVIKHMDNGNTVRFLDMTNHFYKGGDDLVNELFINDLLHLNTPGYRKWAEVMQPLFREMFESV